MRHLRRSLSVDVLLAAYLGMTKPIHVTTFAANDDLFAAQIRKHTEQRTTQTTIF
jgi:adenosyl cobinamide kinase/adenosyl cobinamide phosphate guanylyltransferase